jgi:hypothetical protein
MPMDIVGQLLDRLRALEEKVKKLESGERNIDYIVLRDGITPPTAISGLAYIYIDTTGGDLKIRYGDNFTPTIVADS